MFKFVSMKSIREDFDAAMERQGYVRAKIMTDKWGITASQFQKLLKKGFECDTFVVNGVRYISVNAEGPQMGDAE